ncbi:MAG: hypothetical protein ACYCXN_15450, partial [Acidimicrobiales bacterium]
MFGLYAPARLGGLGFAAGHVDGLPPPMTVVVVTFLTGRCVAGSLWRASAPGAPAISPVLTANNDVMKSVVLFRLIALVPVSLEVI